MATPVCQMVELHGAAHGQPAKTRLVSSFQLGTVRVRLRKIDWPADRRIEHLAWKTTTNGTEVTIPVIALSGTFGHATGDAVSFRWPISESETRTILLARQVVRHIVPTDYDLRFQFNQYGLALRNLRI